MRRFVPVSPAVPLAVVFTLGLGALLAAFDQNPTAAAAEAAAGQPAATLAPDALDAPAPTAVEEAARSAALAAEMATGGHGMMHGSDATYRQFDAGRAAPPNAGHEHGAAPTAAPDVHKAHRPAAPATKPRPKPSPSPSPSPTAHEHHR